MTLTGEMQIGQQCVAGTGEAIQAVNPANNQRLEPIYLGGNKDHVHQACTLAWQAFDDYRTRPFEQRAVFLETIALEIEALGDVLIERAMLESGLPRARLEGERGRTCGQLRLFAKTVRDGNWLDVRIDHALPERVPLPRADLRQQHIALGPVAVFGASNFPLAFSVAGGDTASALAAGCPVVVKAHSAHPGTSELVGKAIQNAVKICALPEGVFSLLFGTGKTVGASLVEHPAIKAVGFTGSRQGGMALVKLAQQRKEPIPVYAEMSSINPVYLLPNVLNTDPVKMAQAFVASLAMGAGQFCTNPGLVIALESDALTQFKETAKQSLAKTPSQTMLTAGICTAFEKNIALVTAQSNAELLATGATQSENQNQCVGHLFAVNADEFLSNDVLQTEMFGVASIVVSCDSLEQVKQVTENLEGQLTATLHMQPQDRAFAQELLPILERKVGRILVNGWPTGVEVCDAMVHGGPYPSTSDTRTTSVGTEAISRFLRPVCYQNFPEDLLPTAMQSDNPLGVLRMIDGKKA
ncbi:aldehyde dehydrogenase (NADP(+)) [Acinetobacter boissieri]|uniref:2,5-dioxovalerate dehydrogenase n=1 Tax=Acinetobacter boissieri TaxID=1219383 RepID=A0A1G6GKR4_9GAMM|nr:aldehyde dehydrogenase (NADP(+)) [Acinetobacter boissieri]SDB82598.1 NADP-dependent aldehyde dehydrogenase [Acinetobacter boissieri]